ncbi:hypothetical protein LAZ67_11001554 [Cordylochernes scorpioides]|uniref:Transposase n=1 Tax=Cordylochernes scorpioides TaxID=51811 RepID=A0ABY6KYJ2_9ARAC|nr:hypothetical protein LAZ67_11001554 [Cordylochernes scorpioides]
MTAQIYITDVLQPVVLLFFEHTNNAIFQTDNTRPHIANISRTFIKNVDILPWPTCSPDISQIEHDEQEIWNVSTV